MSAGKLYIVSSPIGNLEDISLRALKTLETVDYILSEDTRETAKILQKFQLHTPQISYRDQNHTKVISQIISDLQIGKNLALISDSGTPLISDPGFKLVRELAQHDLEVVSIPGPSAVTSALAVSGLPTDKFVFLGFLPKDAGPRKKILLDYGSLDCTLTIFESPFRVKRLLTEIQVVLGDRYCCVAKDLTKGYENITRGYVTKLLEGIEEKRLKGEYVILVAKSNYEPQ